MRDMRILALLAAAALALSCPVARAGSLELLVTELGGPTIPITDNGAMDTDPTVGVINANTPLLNGLLVNYVLTDLSAASNSPGNNAVAFLVQQGTAVLVPGHGGTLTVEASDVDYVQPVGTSRNMNSSASNTYTNATAGDSDAFRSWFNGSNTLGATETPSPLITLVAGDSNPNSRGADAASTPVPLTSPYGLTNVKLISLSGGIVGAAARDAWTGSTVVTAVIPEPTSLVLLLGAVPAIGLTILRGRRA